MKIGVLDRIASHEPLRSVTGAFVTVRGVIAECTAKPVAA
jgi:hypothetical protein